jgi:hypothetical protein
MFTAHPKKILILGASANPSRYSYMAALKLHKEGHPIVLIGARNGEVLGHPIIIDKTVFSDIHTVTVYLSTTNQREYYDYLLELHPQRVIFNPGAENPELERLLSLNSVQTMRACTLVLLSSRQY